MHLVEDRKCDVEHLAFALVNRLEQLLLQVAESGVMRLTHDEDSVALVLDLGVEHEVVELVQVEGVALIFGHRVRSLPVVGLLNDAVDVSIRDFAFLGHHFVVLLESPGHVLLLLHVEVLQELAALISEA